MHDAQYSTVSHPKCGALVHDAKLNPLLGNRLRTALPKWRVQNLMKREPHRVLRSRRELQKSIRHPLPSLQTAQPAKRLNAYVAAFPRRTLAPFRATATPTIRLKTSLATVRSLYNIDGQPIPTVAPAPPGNSHREIATAMDLNRNQFFFIGLLVFLIGFQVRYVSAYVLNPHATQFLADRTGQSTGMTGMFTAGGARKVIQPPEWVSWCLMSVGAVLCLHALAMPKPSG